MGMPALDIDSFMASLKALIDLDRAWVPNTPNSALYIRPVMFACDQYVGVKASKSYQLIIFTCPVGAYYSGEVNVWLETEYVRAFPGGTGAVKAAGNYAPTLYPAQLAQQKGYQQILWTDGLAHKYVEEIGTMNVFFIIDGEAYTPMLDGTILPGITRKSVIQLFKDAGVKVHEKKISSDEIFAAYDAGLLEDMFGVGTAATITHISALGSKERHIELPPIQERKLSLHIKQQLEGIKRGTVQDKYEWLVRV